MEFFSGHDIDGDGKNDIYVRHKVKGDPTGIGTLFLLIFAGMVFLSFSFFCEFDKKALVSREATGLLCIFGSAAFAGILSGWLYGHLGQSYSVPLGGIGLLFAIGLFWVGIIEDMDPEAKKGESEAAKLNNNQDQLRFLQKTEAIRNKIRPIQEKLTAKAHSRGWSIDGAQTTPSGDTEFNPNYRYWIGWFNTHVSYSITAFAPPPLQGLTITVECPIGGNRWIVNMTSKLDQGPRDMIMESTGLPAITSIELQNLQSGKLKDLANELAGYLYSLKVATEKVSKEIDQEAAEELAAQQQEAKERGNRLKGWVVGGVATGSILAIFGLVFFLKRKNKPTTLPPTPTPPQDKPAITTVQRYKYTCSGCSTRYKLTHDALGKSFPCKKCKITCWVPMDVDQLSIE